MSFSKRSVPALMLAVFIALSCQAAYALNSISVVDDQGTAVTQFRWLLEEDTTHPVTPGTHDTASLGVSIHKSYSPVVAAGNQSSLAALYAAVNPAKRYFLSILPDQGSASVKRSIGGASIAAGQASASVLVNRNPIPTAQILVYAFEDNKPINGAPDVPAELPLAGFQVLLFDQAGQMSVDAFGNNLGTTYKKNADGTYMIGADGLPVVDQMGNGVFTGANGEVLVKNLPPGKYGVRVVPPIGTDWVQTSTIEGTPGIDVWIKADEPPALSEFGVLFYHAFFGFVHPMETVTVVPAPPAGSTVTVTGQIVKVHSSRSLLAQVPGTPVENAWIGVNNLSGFDEQVYAAPCDPNTGDFTISDVPPGSYQLVVWDSSLDVIIGFYTFIVPDTGGVVALGMVPVNMWFGSFEGNVFYDANGNGVMDGGEAGMANQLVNLRFRDGSIYQATVTDMMGEYAFNEVFPFFKWLVAEVDYARFKATGATFNVDDGAYSGDPPGITMNPQAQYPVPYIDGVSTPAPVGGPRTELGPVLLEGMILHADQTNTADFGKKAYVVGTDDILGTDDDIPGENGGISGVVFYDTTRAEDNPRLNTGEPWQPGIPGVTVELYEVTGHDAGGLPIIGASPVQTVVTDSWDDNMPTGCNGDDPQFQDCSETLQTWNQMRPAVFNGGYFFAVDPGQYVVKVIPPAGYEVVKSGDQNVYFGDNYKPGIMQLPPPCVGAEYTIPAVLSMDGETPNPAYDAANPAATDCICDMKEVTVVEGQNTAADFFLFTQVPVAARGVGLITNDIGAQGNPTNPGFAEKQTPKWIPVSFKDWAGNEITRTYTDEYGAYNALLPSTYTINPPIPTGVSPNMIQVVLNDKGSDPDNPDIFYDPTYSTVSYTFDFWPGKTTYLDTPVLPMSAAQSISNMDCELADDSPAIKQVDGPEGGPVVKRTPGTVTITAISDAMVPNPAYDPGLWPPNPAIPPLILRHYGFGAAAGAVVVGSVPLQVVSWSDLSIVATVPSGTPTGQLTVVRADGKKTRVGVTLHVRPRSRIKRVLPGTTIQAAIDSARAGSIILVPPGEYFENLILWKRVKLQGYGAGSTTINAGFFTPADQAAWLAKVNNLKKRGRIRLVTGQDSSLTLDKGAGITVFANAANFTKRGNALIDGFRIEGASHGSGINVNGYAHYLEISNNVVSGNQGNFGGGIRLGTPSLVNTAGTGYNSNMNDNIKIHNNMVIRNGGIDGGGGIALFNGSDNYLVDQNTVCGNFSLLYGGGIAHYGLSSGGQVTNNDIMFNQAFDEGGGIILAGELVPAGAPAGTLTPGAGSVTVSGNYILSNIAGDDGGGIRTLSYNGQDVKNNPTNAVTGMPAWHNLEITNNMVANNVTADAGGGISLDDTADCHIFHNTVAHNDSTATSVDAFGFGPAGGQVSTPAPAGIVGRVHSAGLRSAFDASAAQTFSDPLLWNNIVYRNRSWYWDYTADPGVLPTGFLIPRGGVQDAPGQFWDFGVFAAPGAEALGPMSCLITDTPDNAAYDASNVKADPMPASPVSNVILGTSVQIAAGNLITLNLAAAAPSLYDYHILAGSGAIDAGADTLPITSGWLLNLEWDFDQDQRLRSPLPDIGADEYTP